MTDTPTRQALYERRKAERNRAEGKVRRCLWCYPADWPEIRALAERLTERREKDQSDDR